MVVHEDEAAYVTGAGEKRRRDFLSGRALARMALAPFGVGSGPLLPRADRSPQWPGGFVGSITHTDGYCAAAVSPRSRLAGLGIDAENIGAVKPELWPAIFTVNELDALSGRRLGERRILSTVMFSAKEAYFKCQHPITGAWLDFRQAEIGVGNGDLSVTRTDAEPPAVLPRLTGRWSVQGAIALTAFVVSERRA